MSDEYQPNDIAESQSEPGPMPAEPEPMPPEPEAEPTPSSLVDEPGDGASAGRMAAMAEDGDTTKLEGDTQVLDGDGRLRAETGSVQEVPAETPDEHLTDDLAREAPTDVLVPPTAMGQSEPLAEEAPSRVVSIADIETSQRASTEEKRSPLAGVQGLLAGRVWIVAVVAALVLLVALFLPPISLAQRLGGGGYTALDSSTRFVEHPDGLRLSRPDDADGRVRVKLGSIPRAEFAAGSVPETLADAVQSVPEYLVPKSPYYTIDLKSRDPVPGVMSVVIPNESEPWETLDLYSWDGEKWQWQPAQLDRQGEVLVAAVDVLPSSVMVMQSENTSQRVVAEAESWPVEIAPGLTEVDVSGILIGTMGGTTGYADELPIAADGGDVVLVPTVRNWLPGRAPNGALVSDMVSIETDREAHVANLLSLTQGGGYAGLVVDYRDVQAQDRALFAQFVQDLADALHDAGLWLAVAVDVPQQGADGTWDTGGYDWKALGAAADQLRVNMPLSPEAYVPGGTAEQLIQWAVTQVDRHKLLPIYSTLSTDGEQPVLMETVLASVGEVQARETLTESVTPGTALNLSLGGAVAAHTDPETEATEVTVGETTYWLGTPQWLAARMALLSRYQLGGAVLRDLYHEGNVPGLMSGIAALQAGEAPGAFAMPEVAWEVTDPQGKTAEAKASLAQPEFAWRAPTITGTYRVAATVAGLDKGSLEILVAEPAPVITETLAEGDEELGSMANAEEEGDETDDEEVATGLKAAFVADVTVPDNTRFEKGEAFTKTWRMRNAGSEDWPEDTVFAYASGAELSEAKEIEVGVVASGDTVDLSVEMVAPEEDGSYKSTWELRADGKAIPGGASYVLIQVGEAPPPSAEQPAVAPQPVAAGSFELGGHIRDLGIPYRDKMHYAGMNWVKIQVFFGQGASGVINTAHSQGFKIQLSAIGGPDLVTQPGFEDEFASWVAGLAAAGADAIEVWNEPNINREWKEGLISPQSYTNLLCKSYNAIKAANSGTAVISAAPAPTGWFGGCGPNGCDDLPWMQGLYNAGAANCMDYIGAHHNAGATSPSARIGHPANPTDTHHSWFFLPQTELYYNIFRGTRQLFYTEMGYASQEGVPTFDDSFGWARGTDNAEQAAWLAEAVQLSVNTGMVRCIIVWNIDFVRYGTDPQDGFAIIRPGGGCPACDSLHAVLGSR
ncbi:MAG: NBR1-Ig-like domain-containing protein [Anaerolineae bacterium]